MRQVALLLLLLASFARARSAPASGGPAPQSAQRQPVVLCSIAPIASWAINVAGDRARVETLLPADVGPHDFQFRGSDLRRIRSADLIVLNGLGIEDWLDRPLKANAKDLASKVVRISDGLKAEFIYHMPELVLDPKNKRKDDKGHDHDHDHDHSHGHDHEGEAPNPHLWLDPVFARHGVSNILTAMIRIDAAGAEVYRNNAARYLARLEALDAEIRTSVATLGSRTVVTFHDAFPYFLRRYGLDLVGVIEEKPGVEPSPRYISQLLQVVRVRQVKAIFTEPQFSPKLAKRLAADVGVGVGELDVLETGRPSASFYEDGIRKNLRMLEQHLRKTP